MKLITKIAIKLPVPTWKQANEWGDYHIGLALKRELERKGCNVILQTFTEWYDGEDDDCDVIIVLRGLYKYITNKKHFNIMWNISHPDNIEIEEYNQYDHVFIASEMWADTIREKSGVPVDTLLQCTDPELFYHTFKEKDAHDILFVGNSRNVFRKSIKDLLPTDKNLAVYGTNWDNFIDKKYIIGEHIPNTELKDYYSSCKILLNDHWDDMRDKGFISNRLFDGFASGAFIISDNVKGAYNVFGDTLVTYESPDELKDLVDKYLADTPGRIQLALRGEEIVNKYHTFSNRVNDLLKVIDLNIPPSIHFKNLDLSPEVYLDKLWGTIIKQLVAKIDSKIIVEIGTPLLTKNILEYCTNHQAHLTLIKSPLSWTLNNYKAQYGDVLEILTETSLEMISELKYDTIFIDTDRDLSIILDELEIIEQNFKDNNYPLVILHSTNQLDSAKNIENKLNDIDSDYYNLLTNVESYVSKSPRGLAYASTEAFLGLIIIGLKEKEQLIKGSLNNKNLVTAIEEERQKFSLAYHESRSLIEVLETNIIEKKIAIEIRDEEIHSLIESSTKKLEQKENQLKQKDEMLFHLEEQLLHKEEQLKNEKDLLNQARTLFETQINESNRLIKENDKLMETINKQDGQLKKIYSEFDVLSNNIFEYRYNSGKDRSVFQKVISRIPSLFMLSKMNKIGYKNTFINIKAYRTIKKNGLLDTGFYLKNNRDVQLSGRDPLIHYLYYGFEEGRRPNPYFDGNDYLEKHNDVKQSELNPLVHYSLYGINEGRKAGAKHSRDRTQFKVSNIQGTKKKSRVKKSSIRGGINKSEGTVIQGWLAKIGDNNYRTAILRINDRDFEIKSNVLRPDLVKHNINNGEHAFELVVPIELVDKKKHLVKLYDKETMELVAEQEIRLSHNRNFKDFPEFLKNSMVSPLINLPFREEDKRCFAMMEDLAKHLTDITQGLGDDKLVSVIMPVYNRVETVKLAVDSVLNQTYKNIELIIVDDGSKDGSTELLKNLDDERIVLICKENSGVSSARNCGLSVATGDYIAYLDSDNTWDPRYLSAMVGAFTKLTDADALYSGQLLFKGEKMEPFAVRYGSYNKSLLYNRNYIDLNAFCHKREVYQRLGGFYEKIGRYVDYDWIMLVSTTSTMYSVPVLLSNYYYDKAGNTISNDMSLVKYLKTVRDRQMERVEAKNIKRVKIILEKKVSIVIPSYESLEDIKECVDAILSLNQGSMIEIIVVDNNSSQDVVKYLRDLADLNKIKFIENKINYGFTYAVNQGIGIAGKDNDIMILNNDAIVTPGSVVAMQTAAYQLPDCGLVVPQQVLPGGTKTITKHVPYAYPDIECDVNISAHHNNIDKVPVFHSGNTVELTFAPFFCVYIKREILGQSVGLDAEFGRHFRSDRIFCDYVRIVMHKKIYHVSDAIVYHKLQKSTDLIRLDDDQKNTFNLMYIKNQWEPELADQLGFKKAKWDI